MKQLIFCGIIVTFLLFYPKMRKRWNIFWCKRGVKRKVKECLAESRKFLESSHEHVSLVYKIREAILPCFHEELDMREASALKQENDIKCYVISLDEALLCGCEAAELERILLLAQEALAEGRHRREQVENFVEIIDGTIVENFRGKLEHSRVILEYARCVLLVSPMCPSCIERTNEFFSLAEDRVKFIEKLAIYGEDLDRLKYDLKRGDLEVECITNAMKELKMKPNSSKVVHLFSRKGIAC